MAENNRTIPLEQLFNMNIEIKGKIFKVWLAIDPKQKHEGLSFLSSDEVDEDEGMLFIYPFNTQCSFWMKNTLIPLNLAYIKEDGTVVDTYTMPKMSTTLFSSTQKIRYVLELRAGVFKKIGLSVGDTILISKEVKVLSKP